MPSDTNRLVLFDDDLLAYGWWDGQIYRYSPQENRWKKYLTCGAGICFVNVNKKKIAILFSTWKNQIVRL